MQEVVTAGWQRGDCKARFDTAPGVIQVTYCQDSGLRPTDACRADLRGDRSAQGYFVQGTEPRSYCQCHVLRLQEVQQPDVPEGTLLPEEPRRVGLLRIKRNLPSTIYGADQRYAVS